MEQLRKNKFLVFIAVVAILSLLTCAFVACNEDNTQTTKEVEVVFDLNDGSGETVTQTVDPMSITYAPPAREGYDFLHWTLDKAGQTLVSADDLKNGVILYAQWQIKTYTVKFFDEDLNLIKSVTVNHGENATPPTQEEMSDYIPAGRVFVGWNQSIDNVTRNLNVEMITDVSASKYTVIFMDGETQVAKFEDGSAGTVIPKPDNPHARDGFHFEGWKTEDGKVYKEDNLFSADETYYSVWSLQNPSAPQIEGNGELVYGNKADLSLQENSLQEFEGINYVYEWLDKDGNVLASGTEYQTVVLNAGEHAFRVRVTANCEGYDSKSAVSAPKTVTVSKATLTATLAGATITYGDNAPTSLDVTFAGFVNGDDESVVNSDNVEYVTTYQAGNDIGRYNVTATGFEAQNYTFTVQSASLTVEQKQISVNKDFDKVYDGAQATSTIDQAQGLLDGHTIAITLTTSGANVGDYALGNQSNGITAEKHVFNANDEDVTGNYAITVTASASITPANIEYSLPSVTTFDFNGESHSAQLDVATENCQIEYSTDNTTFNVNAPQFVNAGSYKVYARISRANYNSVETSFDITINKAHIAFKATTQTATYGQDFVLDQTAYVIEDGEAFGARFDVTLTTEYKVGDGFGNYTIKVTATEKDTKNFDITTKAGYVAVGRATVDIAIDNVPLTYGDDFTPTLDLAHVSGVYGDDDIQLTITTTYDKATANVVKNEKIIVKINNNNYTLGNVSGGVITIAKKPLAITVNDASVVYGETFDLNSCEIVKGELVNGDTFGDVVLDYADSEYAQGANAGSTFAITATAKVLNGEADCTGNYDITVNNGTLSVLQRDVAVKVNDVSVVYGDDIAESQYGYTVTAGSFYNEANITANYSTTYAGGNFGEGYTVNATINDANHKIVITPGAVNVTKRNANVTYSANVVQTQLGAKPVIDLADLTIGNRFAGDEFSGILQTVSADNGTYTYAENGFEWTTPLSVVNANGDDVTAMYNVAYNFTITIADSAIEHNAQPQSATYNGTDITLNGLKVTETGLNNVAIKYSTNLEEGYTLTSAPSFKDAGEYTVYFHITADDKTPTDGSYTVTIAKKDVTITADDKNTTYGEIAPEYTHSIDGIIAGDTINVTLACAYAQGNAVGTYDITLAYDESANYNVTTVNGTLTVAQRVVNIALQNKEVTYGEDFAPTTALATLDGVYGEDDVQLAVATTYDKANANVGKAEAITATIGNANYVLGEVTGGTVTVTARNIALTVNNATVAYGNAFDRATVTTDKDSVALVNGDVFGDIVISYVGDEYTQGANAGSTFALTATATILNGDADRTGNYNITVTPGTLTVEKRDVSIKTNDKAVTYGDALDLSKHGYTVTAGSFLDADTINATYNTEYAPGMFGSYTITAVFDEATEANYNITQADGAVTINAREVTVSHTQTVAMTGNAYEFDLSTLGAHNLYDGDTIHGILRTASADKGVYTANGALSNQFVVVTPNDLGIYFTNKENTKLADGAYTIKYVLSVEIAEVRIRHSANGINATFNNTEYQGTVEVTDASVTDYTIKYALDTKPSTRDGYTLDVAPKFTNAGAYTVYFLITADGKTPTEGSYTVNIAKAKITFTAQPQTAVFGEAFTLAQNAYEVTGDKYATEFDVKLDTAYVVNNNVGTYDITITATEKGTSNFEVNVVNSTLTVSAKEVTVTANDVNATYGTLASMPEFTVDVESAKEFITLSADYTATSNVDEYAIKATSSSANYTVKLASAYKVIVGKKAITVSADDKNMVYGDPNTELTSTPTGLVEGDTLSGITLSLAKNGTTVTDTLLNAGDYEIVITVDASANANYAITAINGTLAVARRDVSIKTNDKAVTYGDALDLSKHGYTVTAGSFLETAPTATFSTEYAPGMFGSYTITAVFDEAITANYNITQEDGAVTINAREITVSYTETVAMNGEAYEINLSADNAHNLFAGDTIHGVLRTASADKGEYVANGELSNQFVVVEDVLFTRSTDGATVDNNAYSITYELHIEITEEKIPYSAPRVNKTFNNTAHHGSVTVDASITDYTIKYAEGEKPSTHDGYTLNADPEFTNAGTYTVYFLITAEGKTPTEGSYTVNIAKANITFTAQPQTAVFGEAFTLNQEAYTVTGDKYGTEFDVALSTPYVVGNNVGTYDITITATEKGTSNFEVKVVDSTLTVSAKEVTVTANDVNATYGTLASMPEFTVDVESAKEFITLSADYTANSNVGEYAIKATSSSANYNVNLADAYKVIVGKKAITVTADDKDMVYGDAIPSLTSTKTGLVEGDTLSGITLSLAKNGTTVTDTLLNAGDYEIVITVDENANKNYTITTTPGTLAVARRDVSIKTNDKAVTYGDALDLSKHGYTVTAGSFLETAPTATFSTEYAPGMFGSYTITAVFDEAITANYNITQEDGAVTINAREITVSHTQTVAMTGNAYEFDLSTLGAHNLYNGDTLHGTLRTASANVGVYTASGALSDQFVIVEVDGNGVYFKNSSDTKLADGAYTIKYDLRIEIIEDKILNTPTGVTATFNNTEYQGKVEITDTSVTDSVIKYAVDTKPSTRDGYTLDVAPAFTNAGSHTVYFLITAEGKTPTEGSYTVNIAKANITFTAQPQTAVFGDAFTLNQNAYEVTGDKYGTDFVVTLDTPYVVGNNVGTYDITITATEKGTSNFAISVVNSTLTVSAKEVIVTAQDVNATYGTLASMPEFTVDVESAKEFITLSANGYTAKSNVGEYAIKATSSSANYTVKLASAYKVIVGKKAITVSADNKDMVYGDAIPTLTSTPTGLVEGDTLSGITLALAKNGTTVTDTLLNAGDYDIVVNVDASANANYAITAKDGALTVAKRTVTVVTPNINVTYGEAIAESQYKIDTYAYAEGSLEFVGAKPIAVNCETTYVAGSTQNTTWKLSFNADDNYNIIVNDGNITITKRNLTAQDAYEFVQNDGVFHSIDLSTLVLNGEYGEDKLSGAITLASDQADDFRATNLDKFNVTTPIAITNANGEDVTALYNVAYDISVKVVVKRVSVDTTQKTATYNGAEQNQNITLPAEVKEAVVKYAVEPVTTSATTSADTIEYTLDNVSITNAGEYKVYFKITADGWTTTYGSYIVKINKIKATISANNQTTTYGEQIDGTAFTTNGILDSDLASLAISVTTSTKNPSVDTYNNVLTIDYTQNANYEITTSRGTWTVEKKQLTVTAQDVNVTYGDAVPTLAYTSVDGIVEGDTANVVLASTYAQGSPVGDYAITATCSNDNYSVSIDEYFVKVAKRNIKFIVNASVTYGEELVLDDSLTNKDSIELASGDTFGATNLSYKDTVYKVGTPAHTVLTIVADIHIVRGEEDRTANYNIEVVSAPFSVYPARLMATVTLDKTTIEYGNPLPTATITYDGFVNGDTADKAIQKAPTVKFDTETPNAGTHTVSIVTTEEDSRNYRIEPINATYEVTKAELTVSLKNANVTFGDETPTVECTLTGLIDRDKAIEADIIKGITYTITDSAGASYVAWKSNAGQTFTISASTDTVLDNYTIKAGNTAKLTVVARDISVTITGTATVVYGMSNIDYSALAWDKQGYETSAGNWNLGATFGIVEGGYVAGTTNAGTYANAVMIVDWTNKNFNITEQTYGTLVVEKSRNVTISHADSLEADWNTSGIDLQTAINGSSSNTDDHSVTYNITSAPFAQNGATKVTDGGVYKITIVSKETTNFYSVTKDITFKVKAATIGSTYYTVEDAVSQANATATLVGNAFVSNMTVASGTTLILPADGDSANIGSPTYTAGGQDYVDESTTMIQRKLTIPSGVTVNVSGTILVQGLLGSTSHPKQGHTSGKHSQIINNGTINLNNGSKLDLRGYIKGNGIVNHNSGSTTYSPFVVLDYHGGQNTVGSYSGGNIAPFNQYELPNIQCNSDIYKGANYIGYCDLYASDQHNTATPSIYGDNGIIRINDGVVHRSYTPNNKATTEPDQKTTLNLVGSFELGSLSLTVKVSIISKTVSMADVLFPISWTHKIIIGDGTTPTTLLTKYKYKLMPKAYIEIKPNATLSLKMQDSGDGTQAIVYSGITYKENKWPYPYTTNEAELIVNGTLEINGMKTSGWSSKEYKALFGGKIKSNTPNAKIVVGQYFTNTITSKEGWGESNIITNTFHETASITETAKAVNNDGSTVDLSANKTYTYNGSTWG